MDALTSDAKNGVLSSCPDANARVSDVEAVEGSYDTNSRDSVLDAKADGGEQAVDVLHGAQFTKQVDVGFAHAQMPHTVAGATTTSRAGAKLAKAALTDPSVLEKFEKGHTNTVRELRYRSEGLGNPPLERSDFNRTARDLYKPKLHPRGKVGRHGKTRVLVRLDVRVEELLQRGDRSV